MGTNSSLNFRRVTAVYQCLFEFLFGFLGIGATIWIRWESWCFPYAEFFFIFGFFLEKLIWANWDFICNSYLFSVALRTSLNSAPTLPLACPCCFPLPLHGPVALVLTLQTYFTCCPCPCPNTTNLLLCFALALPLHFQPTIVVALFYRVNLIILY